MIEIFVNVGPEGRNYFKTLVFLQLRFFLNQTFSQCSLGQSSQKLLIGILKFQFIFKRLKFTIVGKYENKKMPVSWK